MMPANRGSECTSAQRKKGTLPMKNCQPVTICLALLASAFSAFSQADRGVITGIVTDQQGAAIPNAAVQIVNENTQVITSIAATTSGNYTSPPLIIGTYTVKVELPGFKS